MTAAALLLAFGGAASAAADYGILLLAHGGDPSWDREVRSVAKELARRAPTEVAVGMADPAELQRAVRRLEGRRPSRLIAVPLFVNSASEVLDHTRYLLGLSDTPSEVLREGLERMARAHAAHAGHGGAHAGSSSAAPAHRHAFSLERVKTSLPLVMTPALDDHPLVAEILLARAKALSAEPAKETLVLVGHGPVDDRAESAWRETMGRLAEGIKGAAGLRAAAAVTLRDDAAPEVRAAAVARLRGLVERAAEGGGRALVVPYLVARGGIEGKVQAALAGLSYAWDGRTVLPHPNVARWALASAREAWLSRGAEAKK